MGVVRRAVGVNDGCTSLLAIMNVFCLNILVNDPAAMMSLRNSSKSSNTSIAGSAATAATAGGARGRGGASNAGVRGLRAVSKRHHRRRVVDKYLLVFYF